jgi:precorrin-2 dehydrogenase/sirohydrochlorin ferrochelatase
MSNAPLQKKPASAEPTPGAKPGVGALPYIICVDLDDQVTCVVGGGKVAARKVESLLEAGAIVHVIADHLCDDLRAKLGEKPPTGRLVWHEGPYQQNLPAGSRLVIACTDNREVNRRVREDCRISRALCNVVDDPELCDFIVPAVRQVGRVQIAISTGGASPTLARDLVEQIMPEVDSTVADLAQLLAEVRLEVQAEIPDTRRRKECFGELSGSESLCICKELGKDGWRQWFRQRLAHYKQL